MKRVLFLIGVFCIGLQSINAQIITSPDTAVCGSYEDTLQAMSAVASSMSSDDYHDVLLDIGFTFNFYGVPYTQLVISGNGYVTFDATQATTPSPWVIGAAIPNPGSMPENAIMVPWQDLNTQIGGAIYFGMTGVAPNRRYIITWCAVPMFSCTSDLHTSQLVLYEGSDKIEMFIQNKPLCITWNGGHAVHGLVDATSTNADIVIDPITTLPRNWSFIPTPWIAVNEGWEFLPNNPATSYTINQIGYVPIIAGLNTWTDAAGNILGTGPSLPVNISTSTVYYANVTGACALGNLSDSVSIIVTACFALDLTSTEASCLGDNATLTCTPDTLLPLWDCELLDMNGTTLDFMPNLTSTDYTFNNLFPGTYVVSVSSGITVSQDTLVVTQIQNPVTIFSTPVGVSCYNGSDGQVAIWPSGGLAPYTFLINGNPILNAFPLDSLVENLSGGTYIVSAIDDNNCMMRDTVEITTPSHPLQALATSKVVVCHGGSSGFIVGFSAGGTPGYVYSWYESGNPVSFSGNDTVVGLSAGSYYLEVTDTNGCDTFTVVNVIEPQFALQGSPQIFGVICKGDSTGMLVGDAGGGWGPYVYHWLDTQGDTLQSSINTSSTRDTLFDLFSGIYVLHIYDIRGCFVDYVLNVPEPSIGLSIDSLVLIESIACYSDSVGKAILYASGGQLNYAYLWDNGETTTVADGLTSGYHSVVLSDDWGCEVLDSIYIPEHSLIESDLTTVQDVSCYGLFDGIATISSIGGSSSLYTYFWSQGQQTVGVNTDIAAGLLQGSYYVTTRDALGCEVVDSIYISEPEPLSMEASELDWIDCYNDSTGEAFATATGGTLPYVFDWDNGQWIGDTVNTLTAGEHTVVVTDAKGCTASDTVFTHEPTELVIAIDETQTILPYCIGVNTASLTGVADGGTLGYTYVWDDNNNLPQTTTTASALLADNYNSSDSSYTITVTDAKGCVASVSTDTLRFYVASMDANITSLYQYASGSSDSNEVSCFGYNDGGAEATAWGAHGPYAYQWFGGSSATTAAIDNLYAGVYSVTIRDTNNCMVNRSIVLVQPAALTYNVSLSSNESCLGACDGTIVVDSLAGGVAPYAALLTDNATALLSSHIMSAANTILGVCSGDYTIALTDVNACPSSVIPGGVSQQLLGYDAYTTADILGVEDTVCHAASTGELAVSVPNSNPSYTYSWQDLNGGVVSTTATATNLAAGVYVLLADYNTSAICTASDTIEIIELAEIQNAVTIEHVACYGESTGSILASASGTVPTYSYAWSSGQTTALASNLSAGTYALTIEDGNGCERDFTHTVTEPLGLDLIVTQNNFTLTALVSLGTSPYTYEWFKQGVPPQVLSTNASYTVSSNGTYYVVVTDANICVLTSDMIVYGSVGVVEAGLLGLSIYPNPFKQETTVDFGREVKQASIKVVDVFGKLIEEHTITNTEKHSLKRNNKAAGVYFVEIEVEQQEKVIFKLIVE
jgi:uncharacterized protein (DUF2141 family)